MTLTSHTRTRIADASLTLNCCRRYPKTSEGPVYSVFATVFLQLIVCWISIHVLQEQVRNVSLTPVLSQVQNTRNHVDLWRNEGDCQRADGLNLKTCDLEECWRLPSPLSFLVFLISSEQMVSTVRDDSSASTADCLSSHSPKLGALGKRQALCATEYLYALQHRGLNSHPADEAAFSAEAFTQNSTLVLRVVIWSIDTRVTNLGHTKLTQPPHVPSWESGPSKERTSTTKQMGVTWFFGLAKAWAHHMAWHYLRISYLPLPNMKCCHIAPYQL